MLKTMVFLSLILFGLTAITGIWMRTSPFIDGELIPYEYLLHAHSHLAIIGWAFTGVLIVFIAVIWTGMTRQEQRHGNLIAIVLFVASLFMFGAFLYQGYALYSIILSTLHIGIEYWAALFIYRRIPLIKDVSIIASLFIKAGLVTLVISTIGPFLLGAIAANGLKDSAWFDMVIYFYLHFQYNGWLFFMLMGLLVFILTKAHIKVNHMELKHGFWIYFIALFPGYLLSILWVDLPTFAYVPAIAGSVGQWVGIFYMLWAISKSWSEIMRKFSQWVGCSLGFVLMLLFGKSTLELGLMMPNLANMIYETRSIVVGYLHLTLLGFVSMMIVTLYLMTGLLGNRQKSMSYGLMVFISGLILNEGLLFLMGVFEWMNFPAIPFASQGLMVAALLLFIGIISISCSTVSGNPLQKVYIKKHSRSEWRQHIMHK